jgi:DnaJ-class molecular chaperone
MTPQPLCSRCGGSGSVGGHRDPDCRGQTFLFPRPAWSVQNGRICRHCLGSGREPAREERRTDAEPGPAADR